MSIPYTPPSFLCDAFNCPFCHAYANHIWSYPELYNTMGRSYVKGVEVKNIGISTCLRCNMDAIWVSEKMVYPSISIAPPPTGDMPDDIKLDYAEASEIVVQSPRGAAALLRLCIQKLCAHLGEKGENINKDIQSLVSKGLSPTVQQALDIVRVVGNDCVHPGQIDIKDDPETAIALFKLVNYIVEDRITKPREIRNLYNSLPAEKIKGIEARDKKVT